MRFDLHVHTYYSRGIFGQDGISSPKEIIKAAKAKGLDGIAITDHDSVGGLREAERFGKKLGIIVIPGIEIRTMAGDILALGVKDIVEKNLTVNETIERIHDLGGLAVAAHPFSYWPGRGFGKELGKKMYKFDAIEGFNAGVFNNNKKACALAEKLRLPVTAGSDAHCAKHVGLAYAECAGSKPDDVLASIRAGKTIIKGKSMGFAAWMWLIGKKIRMKGKFW